MPRKTISIDEKNWGYIKRLMKAADYENFNEFFNDTVMELMFGCLDPDLEGILITVQAISNDNVDTFKCDSNLSYFNNDTPFYPR